MSHWRSIEERLHQPEFSDEFDYEYKPTESELRQLGVSRRKFLGLMGASMALAGLSTSGCIRKPVEYILPYNQRPENIIPGQPLYFATAMNVGRVVQGIIVESQEGRPTKIEGNPDHPMNKGASSIWAQSSALDLYDPDRSRYPAHAGRQTTWGTLFEQLDQALARSRNQKGKGLALLIEDSPSPSCRDLLNKLSQKLPESVIAVYDPTRPSNQIEGEKMVGLDTLHAFYNLEQAKCILSLDADFLGKDGHVVRHARDFALHRDISELEMQGDLSEVEDKINRLYVVESGFSVTGAKADHRLRMQSSQIGEFLNLFADNILKQKIDKLPPDSEQLVKAIQQRAELFRKQHENLYRSWQKWLEVLGEDLAQNTGKSVVWVGTRQPPHVHALAYFLNQILENIDADASIQFIPNNTPIQAKEINELADLIKTGRIEQLIILGGNPVYNAPVDLQFATLLQSVPYSLHLSLHLDETSQVATWHAPMNHFLESWGDLRSTDGTVSIQQPLIAPLYGTLSALELLAHITGEQPTKGYDIVRAYWRQIYEGKGDFEKQWRRWLHEGVVHGAEERHKAFVLNWSRLAHSLSTTELHILEDTLELNFMLDTSVCDGRFANNAWLQEMPDPITKLTWDNAALIGTRMAREHQLKNGQWLSLKHLDRTLDIPVFIIPGLADHTIFLPLGYGRSFNGRVATGSGFNTYQLRDSRSQYFSYGVTFHKLPKPAYKLISTQEHGRIGQSLFAGYGSLTEPTLAGIKGTTRDSILRYADLKDYLKNPDIIAKKDPHSTSDHPMRRGRSLWKEPNATGGQQWGLVIDLSRCNGCSACVIACQAENNIAVVGKAQVAIGREMHWLRIDRYFRGDDDNPAIDIQPIACAHCENAPCEGVCPVAATVHSPDGLNDIAYNRCIGTRYCANNCPYKVRRFNFFNYSRQNSEQLPLLEMQRNPDVTVRSRGVIEKCSYCVQRINAAKIAAKRDGDGLIPDGTIVPACVQACPSEAIVFGDINDPNSRVAKLKAIKRNYRIFDELNIQPRTTYLASLRNPNRKLG